MIDGFRVALPILRAALQLAISQRQPRAGLIVHSDRGSQYASHEHRNLLTK